MNQDFFKLCTLYVLNYSWEIMAFNDGGKRQKWLNHIKQFSTELYYVTLLCNWTFTMLSKGFVQEQLWP